MPEVGMSSQISSLLSSVTSGEFRYREPSFEPGSPSAPFLFENNRDFPLKHQSTFGRFLKTAEAGPTLLYHCSAGKDRAGFATLLLLSALGVAPDAILANYLESNHQNRRLIREILTRLNSLGIAHDVAMPLLEVRPGYLLASLHTIQQEWGSMAKFLGEVMVVEVEQLRAHYLVQR